MLLLTLDSQKKLAFEMNSCVDYYRERFLLSTPKQRDFPILLQITRPLAL